MKVLKFGGSSVANAANIKKVADIIINQSKSDGKFIVVLSALSGVTDLLLKCGATAASGDQQYKEILKQILHKHLDAVKELMPLSNQSAALSEVMESCNEIEDILTGIFLLKEISARTTDRLTAYGEVLSSRIISAFLHSQGVDNSWTDSRQIIKTNSAFTKAAVEFTETNVRAQTLFNQSSANIFILPGFIASDAAGNTTTLGRGGSDYTAAIIGAALDASEVQIWTDVSGMMTADPRLVTNARAIPSISYEEAMELSHFGAKVIYAPTMQPVMHKNIPMVVKNTFAPDDEGTIVVQRHSESIQTIKGISSIDKISLLSLEGSGMVGIPGFSKRLFDSLANQQINVILITQASSEHSICVGVEASMVDVAKKIIDAQFEFEISTEKVDPVIIENDLAIVALVGDNMKNHVGTSGKMFSALGRNGVNIRAIAQGSSERNISAVIASSDIKKAINVLHEEFFETTYRQVNVFIAGTGNVGQKLIAQIQQQQEYLKDHLRIQLRISGIANSRKMIFDEEEINPSQWKSLLTDGETADINAFVQGIISRNLRNSVFVDVTANAGVAGIYENLFAKSISVVACNKIACSSSFENYKKLKFLARDHSAAFMFETNVGAGLPVIGTLNDLLRSGDSVNKIQAVLSGTLNFVFNNYDGTKKFAEVVRQAQAEGYTEPDPRLDLGGTDVMRKIMILAREAGHALEMEEIENNSFMPASCMEGSVEDFYQEMEVQESHFSKLLDAANAEGKKLKFVASFEDGKASVGLQHIDPSHDFYHLYGKDNIVLFYTNRYVDQPLVIKGAGAGAEVTASGVFADVIRAATN